MVTASVACGCSLHDLRLQVHQLFNGGNYREALQVAEEQMELLKNAYGPSHHEYATAMNNVATLFQAPY